MQTPMITKVIPDIFKPGIDERTYRGLVLSNDMKIVLISDPKTDVSAAALDVNIGHFMDPDNLPGLAHFLEHMVFMGSKKFPVENEFDSFLSRHGGSYNAYTMEEHTHYYFDVTAGYLAPSLDRFAQFFIAPLMSESGTEREVNAVNSEHTNNITNDAWRMDAIMNATSDPAHPFHKFGTGNLETLWFKPKEQKISVREALLKLHSETYSSNIMSLAVLGKESLDELQTMAVDMFRYVKNLSFQVLTWPENPFRQQDLQKYIYYEPVNDIRRLTLIWPVFDPHAYWRCSPEHYVSDLIGHEGRGSILSEFKRLGWVNTLSAGLQDRSRGFALFCIDMQLSVPGLDHTDEIISVIYSYIAMLLKRGPDYEHWCEQQLILKIKFDFHDKVKPHKLVQNVAMTAQEYPIEEVLRAKFLMDDYNSDVIARLLNCLVPEKMRVLLVSKTFKDKVAHGVEEKNYDARYLIEQIKAETVAGWREILEGKTTPNERIFFPEKNEFIAKNFQLLCATNDKNGDAIIPPPVKIVKTHMSTWWYKLDEQFHSPKACLKIAFLLPATHQSAKNACLVRLFTILFCDAFNEAAYPAWLAGLFSEITQNKSGILVSIVGFNDKMENYAKMVLDKLLSFKEFSRERFNILKEMQERKFKNFFNLAPYKQSAQYFDDALASAHFTVTELIDAMPEATYERMCAFITDEMWRCVKIQGFGIGNIGELAVEGLAKYLEDALVAKSCAAASETELVKAQMLKLPAKQAFVWNLENKVHLSSSVCAYYQFGYENSDLIVITQLIDQMFADACFDMLRTKEQLGYIVFCTQKIVAGVGGVVICVQSQRATHYVDDRIEAFIGHMREEMNQMSREAFSEHVKALMIRRLEKPKTLKELAEKWWKEIFNEQYHFNRDRIEVESLRRLKKEDVINFIDKCLMPDSEQRRKFAIHIKSLRKSGDGAVELTDEDMNTCSEDEGSDVASSMELDHEAVVGGDNNSLANPDKDYIASEIQQRALEVDSIHKFKQTCEFHPPAPCYY